MLIDDLQKFARSEPQFHCGFERALIGRGSLHEQPHFTAFKPLTERVPEAFCIRYQSGLYLATLRLCSASVFANISAPLSGSIRQK